MSYVEAIEYQSPMQIQAHRERMERLRRLGGVPMPRQVIKFRPKPVEVVVEPRHEEPEPSAPAIGIRQPPEVVVSSVDIMASPAIGLASIDAARKTPRIAAVQKAVCAKYGVTMLEMLGDRRPLRIVMPRQIAMYLCKTMTGRSFPEIGRKFGDRDHTTVLHAVRKIEAMVGKDPAFAKQIDGIVQEIEQEIPA